MQAIVYRKEERKAGLTELPPPRPETPSEVLFRPRYAAICGSDLHMFHGSHAYGWVRSPLILGHEVVGAVAGADGLFVLDPYIPCGKCPMCRAGSTSTCMGPSGGRDKESPPYSLQYGFRRHGGMAEVIAVEGANLVPVPEGLSPRLAALSESVAVAGHGIEAGTRLIGGAAARTAAVLGPGPVGLGAALILASRGFAVAVLGLPQDAERLKRARAVGAAAAVDDPKALESAVDEWTDGAGVDLVIEATGAGPAWETGVRVVRRGGAIVALGIPQGGLTLPVRQLVRGGVLVAGAYGVTPADLEAALRLLASDEAKGSALFDRSFPLDAGDEAFEYASHSSAKVLVSVGVEG